MSNTSNITAKMRFTFNRSKLNHKAITLWLFFSNTVLFILYISTKFEYHTLYDNTISLDEHNGVVSSLHHSLSLSKQQNTHLFQEVEKMKRSHFVEECELYPGLEINLERDFSNWPEIFNFNPYTNTTWLMIDSCRVWMQIIDQQLYILQEFETPQQSRVLSIKGLIYDLLQTHRIPDVEFCIGVDDFMIADQSFGAMPPLVFTKTAYDVSVLIPHFELGIFPEANMKHWTLQKNIMMNQSAKYPWDRKIRRAYWSGTRTMKIQTDFENYVFDRPDFYTLNFHEGDTKNTIPDYDFENICEYSYLLHFENIPYSAKIKYLLLCNSTLLWVRSSAYYEFWYHLLIDDVHYVPIYMDDKNYVLDVIQSLYDNEDQAIAIAENGYNLVKDVLTKENINCYMQKVFEIYASRMTWKPQKEQNAKDFYSSIAYKSELKN